MNDAVKIEDLNNEDAALLLKNIIDIMFIAEKQLSNGEANPRVFAVYKLARDSRDLLTQDAASRDVMRRLSRDDTEVKVPQLGTVRVPYELMEYIKSHSHQKIEAIRQARAVLNLGLKEAKDLVETILGV